MGRQLPLSDHQLTSFLFALPSSLPGVRLNSDSKNSVVNLVLDFRKVEGDGWMDEWMEGWVDEWMGEWMV